MSTDVAVAEAADAYANLPANFGPNNDHYRTTGRNAFVAGNEWRSNRPTRDGIYEAAEGYAAKHCTSRHHPLRIEMVDAFLAGVAWREAHG